MSKTHLSLLFCLSMSVLSACGADGASQDDRALKTLKSSSALTGNEQDAAQACVDTYSSCSEAADSDDAEQACRDGATTCLTHGDVGAVVDVGDDGIVILEPATRDDTGANGDDGYCTRVVRACADDGNGENCQAQVSLCAQDGDGDSVRAGDGTISIGDDDGCNAGDGDGNGGDGDGDDSNVGVGTGDGQRGNGPA
jgi:hypothetical protein